MKRFATFVICSVLSLHAVYANGRDIGNGRVINFDTAKIEFIIRERGSSVERRISLAAGQTLRLRNFENYELFLGSSVYDLDAKAADSDASPWTQHLYTVFRNENGAWVLGKGMIAPVRAAARQHVASAREKLTSKWARTISPTKSLRIEPVQLWFCKAFVLENFIYEKFGLKVRVHPDFGLGNEDPLIPDELFIEAITCQPVPQSVQQGLTRLISEAMNLPHAKSSFFNSCESEMRGDAVWEAFVKLCNEMTKVINEPATEASFNKSTNEAAEIIRLGYFYGVDGSGSNLDRAAVEKARLNSILSNNQFIIFRSGKEAILDDIRAILKLDGETGEIAAKRKWLMPLRIQARYGCLFLHFASPREKAASVSIGDRPVIYFYVQNTKDMSSAESPEVAYTVKTIRLRNVEVQVDENLWERVRYRPAGFKQLIARTTDANQKALLEQKYQSLWDDLPIGDDVGYNFKPSNRFSVRAIGSGVVKEFDFNPISNRTFIFGSILKVSHRPEPPGT